KIEFDEVVPKLLAIAESGYNERIFVRGDKTVDYQAVMKVMGAIYKAGFRRIGLVTETEEK
ncbi:MAG TPA: protein TolR, partial [Rhizobiales bacterium]|nr:protein TolR [Hyphomicrobiales bacterium]